MVVRRLAGLKAGELELCDDVGEERYGEASDLRVRVDVSRPRFYRRVLLGGSVGAAEAFMDGDCECSDLTSLVRLFVRDATAASRLDSASATLARWISRMSHGLNANTRSGSRRNIRAHYDLGNEFFSLWLDETFAYSSGFFLSPAATLQEASVEKFDRVCRKLDLRSNDRLLEIGSGWGGFAIHAAREYGCHVTTATISPAQYELARQRIAAAGLSDRVTLLLKDYRDLDDRFDKLASIEMVEAVGYRNLNTYFRKCGELLTDLRVANERFGVRLRREIHETTRNRGRVGTASSAGGGVDRTGAADVGDRPPRRVRSVERASLEGGSPRRGYGGARRFASPRSEAETDR
jgi:cyclopropane-fatty-acyl-phospholipid synthase